MKLHLIRKASTVSCKCKLIGNPTLTGGLPTLRSRLIYSVWSVHSLSRFVTKLRAACLPRSSPRARAPNPRKRTRAALTACRHHDEERKGPQPARSVGSPQTRQSNNRSRNTSSRIIVAGHCYLLRHFSLCLPLSRKPRRLGSLRVDKLSGVRE